MAQRACPVKNIFSVKEKVPSEFFNQPYVDKGRKEKRAEANRNTMTLKAKVPRTLRVLNFEPGVEM